MALPRWLNHRHDRSATKCGTAQITLDNPGIPC